MIEACQKANEEQKTMIEKLNSFAEKK